MATSDALRRVGRRLRAAWRTLLQVALAIGGSWALATVAFGYDTPFFAPIAAIIVLNNPAQRGRRALEIVGGVAAGIAVADLLVLLVGTGWWQLVLVATLAMAVVTAAGGGPLVVTQAAVAAILVVTFQPPTADLVPHRFFHAVIGGSTAVLVTSVLPPAPDRQLGRAAQPLVRALVATLHEVAEAFHRGDVAGADAALDRARGLDDAVAELRRSVEVAAETARMAPLRRGQRELVVAYASVADQLDLAVRNTRVLARAGVQLLRLGSPGPDAPAAPAALGDAVLDLADAVRALGAQLAGDGSPEATRRSAGAAAARTRALSGGPRDLAVSRVVGQIRSTGIDLLRCSGLELDAAQRTLYDAPTPPPRPPTPS